MVLDWLGSKGASVGDLIARKNYAKAIEVIKAQLQQRRSDERLRLQLADVLVMAGRGPEAISILIGLADEFAVEGFAAKAIAVLKKIEKIDPGRADVERKLASLIQEKHRALPRGSAAPSPSKAMPEFGMEEIEEGPVDSGAAIAAFEQAMQQAAEEPAAAAAIEGVTAVPMSDDAFRDQLLDVIQATLHEPAAAGSETPTAGGGGPVVESLLFSDFSSEELVAVIHGLRLLSFEPGDIVITEGEPGDSLFILSTGTVKAFIRNPAGRHVQVREMGDGAFFGEISILTGRPRTATVTAATRCELLELDRPTLDSIAETHPRVLEVLQDFCKLRAGSAAEKRVRDSSRA